MSDPNSLAPDADEDAVTSAEWVRRRFLAACDESREDQPPDVDAYLSRIPEPDRSRCARSWSRRGRTAGAAAAPATRRSRPRPRGAGRHDGLSAARRGRGDARCASDATAAEPAVVDHQAATVAPEAGRLVDSHAPDAVAGYEVLGVLGRGGMGVVYKARQVGLNRLVALKMILSGDHAGERERARFRSEAEAVARIQHPNIIQIYDIGEEAGRPYFSLEYVDGGSLAVRIHGEPQPPREAARIVHLLAGAMDCAHRAGVVHRDLKPANVLLTADGQPKITDFGLAKRLQEGAGQTQSGSILGTPGYMAPEQAEGKNEEVGPPADVYALGAILYELLTGRMPFRAPTILETLEQVRTREPVAPAELQPGVPRDLDTICLKCLQKDPRRRYDGAGALEEDLRRFLGHEPILARRVGRLERAWRWRRRNPRLAALGAATVAIVVAWAVSMSALAWGLKLQKDQTDLAAAAARANQEQADRNAAAAQDNEKKAAQSAAAARVSADVANKNADVAVHRVSKTIVGVELRLNARLFAPDASPELRALGDDVLNQMRDGMLGMAKDLEATGANPFAGVAIHQEMGDLLKRLGRGEEALQQFRKGRDLAEKIAAEQPDQDKARANLALMIKRLGAMELELNGDPRAAHDHFDEARALQQDVADRPRSGDYTDVDNKRLLSHYEVDLGKADLASGDAAAARGHFDKAVSLREAWCEAQPQRVEARSYLSEAHYWRGAAAGLLGDAKASAESFDAALSICRDLAGKYPKDFSFRADLAEVLGAKGDAQLRLGKWTEADDSYRDSLENLRAALQHVTDDIDYQVQLARAEERLATVAALKGDRDAADKAYREALRVRLQLLDIEPNNLTWQAACLPTLAHCGKESEAAKKAEELCAKHPKSVPLLLDAARCYAACARTAGDDAARKRDVEKAVAALRAASEAGYKDGIAWKTDPDLAPLRDEAPFRSLLEEAAKR